MIDRMMTDGRELKFPGWPSTNVPLALLSPPDYVRYTTKMLEGRSPVRRLARSIISNVWPNQRLRWTREGLFYFFVWCGLLGTGLQQTDQPDPARGGSRGRPDGRLDLRQRIDASKTADFPTSSDLCLFRRTTFDRLYAGKPSSVVGRPGLDLER